MMLLLSLLLVFLGTAQAWNPEENECLPRSAICFTSFVWCRPFDSNDCHYPDGVYPQATNRGPFPAIVWGREYNVSWRASVPRWPVTVWWQFEYREEFESGRNGTPPQVMWERNVSDASFFTFKPEPDMFPNPLSPNISSTTAQGLALGRSYLRIQQFLPKILDNGTEIETSEGRDDISWEFTTVTEIVENYIQHARNSEADDWRRKMTLGLGLGIGLTIIVTYLITYGFAWFWAKRSVRKRGEKGLTARRWWAGF